MVILPEKSNKYSVNSIIIDIYYQINKLTP